MFAYANEIASLCDVAGANVLEVVQAGKKGYPRTNVALPGLVGGPCLTKDSYILDQSVADFGIRPNIIMEGRKTNEDQPFYVANFLKPLADKFEWPEDMKVALLGLAFKGKPATDDLRGTMALPVLNALKAVFPQASYWGFDQVVSREDTKEMGLLYAGSIAQALEGTHLSLIVNNHPIFEQFGVSQKTHLMAIPGLVYDFWNTLNIENTQFADGVYYISVGNHRLCLDIIDK
jgi:UDP-N-acetyl-D-mannosaminuronic acid dehydrogenase